MSSSDKFNRDFFEKMSRLGVHPGSHIPPPQGKTPRLFSIETVLDGKSKPSRFGTSTLITENIYGQNYQHGKTIPTRYKDQRLIYQWAKIETTGGESIEKVIFLDIETSGLSGGAGTIPFMIGLGYFESGHFKVDQLFLKDPGFEESFLSELEERVCGFEVIVTYNGKSFDIPVLRSRYILHQYPNPFAGFSQIDLLHLSRRIWKGRLERRKLSDLEKYILHFNRSEDEIPGWLVPQIYQDYLHSGDARPMVGVFYHNAMDILSMAALYTEFSIMFSEPISIYNQQDRISVGQLYEDLQFSNEAQTIYQSCNPDLMSRQQQIRVLLRSAKLSHKNNDHVSAISLWGQAAILGSIEGHLALSKYYEHQLKDYHKAYLYAQSGLELAQKDDPFGDISKYHQDFIKRINRIIRRINQLEKLDVRRKV